MSKKKRMLNTDYYKLDAKYMRSSLTQDKKHSYTVIESKKRSWHLHK